MPNKGPFRDKKAKPVLEKKVNVIITLKDGYDPQLLNLDSYTQLMNGIVTATINESNIEELSKNENVIAVENDSQMDIL